MKVLAPHEDSVLLLSVQRLHPTPGAFGHIQLFVSVQSSKETGRLPVIIKN